jgi:biopolymer transport protein ExbB
MSFTRTAIRILVCAALLGATGAGALGEEDATARLDAALAQARKDLGAEKAHRTTDDQAYAREKETLGLEIVELEKALAREKTALAEEKKVLAEKGREIDALAIREADLSDRLAGLCDFVSGGLEILATRVHLSIPHSRRPLRVAAVRELRTRAGKPGVDSAGLVGDYFQCLYDEAELGASSELFALRVALDSGEEKEADALRIGKVFCAYLTRDRQQAGLLFRAGGDKGGHIWKEAEGTALARRLEEAIAEAGQNDAQVELPLDVTLDMTPDFLAAEKDIIATLVAGGPVVLPLILVGLAAVLLILERAFVLQRQRPRSLKVRKLGLGPAQAGDFDAANRFLAMGRGPLARAPHAGIRVRDTGKKAKEDAITEAALTETARLERRLSTIAALAVVSPLLGLLGTVTGMIGTFDVITIFGTGDPRLLSGGISEALITTQVGLVIAIPVLLAHTFLSGRVTTTVQEIETQGAALVNAVIYPETPKEDE